MTSALVVGGGGLLGSALVRQLESRGVRARRARVRWASDKADEDLAEAARDWLDGDGEAWLLWCAGVGVVSTAPGMIDAEVERCRRLLAQVELLGVDRRITAFLASSAGGVYAGSAGAPFDEKSPTRALTRYGAAKLELESDFARLAGRLGWTTLAGRLANLYGPQQSLAKQQGFISHLCRSMLTRTPIAIYVPLDTIRDYLHVDDAAVRIVRWLETSRDPGHTTKVIGSFAPATIGQVLHEARLLFKRAPQAVVAASPLSAGQVRDLRLGSAVRVDLDQLSHRPIGVGMHEIKSALELSVRLRGVGTAP